MAKFLTRLPMRNVLLTNVARASLLVASLAAPFLAAPHAEAQQQLESKVPIAFNRFYDEPEIVDLCRKLCAAYPDLASMEEIGKSVQGRPMYAITVNNPKTGPDSSKPAMYIDGNIHGNEIQAAEVVVYTLWYLLAGYGKVDAITELVDRSAIYLIPLANPDGRAYWFSHPNSPNSSRGGQKPTDDDRDGLLDEDGPDDLDGDGSITVMWRRDPNGTHKRSELDPNVMEPVSREPLPDGTIRRGEWSMAGSEGIDNDGDGQTNEDGPGGYDPNRNWPADWQPDHVQNGAGAYPLSLPESQAVAGFILKRPNIIAGQAYHNAGGMILRGPGAQDRDSAYSPRDVAVYDAIANAGAEMLPYYRNMVIWRDLYAVRGGFVNWLSESLGAMAFTNELWSDKRILQNGNEPSPEEMRRWRERVLLDQVTSPLKEVQHPVFGTVLVGGGTKYSSRIPPPFLLEEECHRNFAFTLFHAGEMPKLRFGAITTVPLDPAGTLWQVDVEVANDKLMPSRTDRAASKGIGLADRVTVSGDATVVLSGTVRESSAKSLQTEERYHPATVRLEDGVPGRSSRVIRFVVRGKEGDTLRVAYDAEKASDLSTTTTLKKPAT
jgi:hypothetical protein